MKWSSLHAELMAVAFAKALEGSAERGTIAYVRCLTPDVVELLVGDSAFKLPNWHIRRVSDVADEGTRTITADQAVELREAKGKAVLLLVDTTRAGAGMDGIYSAAREIDEGTLFTQAKRLALKEISDRMPRGTRKKAELALKRARGFGNRYGIPPWTEYDFLIRVVAEQKQPGELLHLLGLWPVEQENDADFNLALDTSRLFVERLLGAAVAGLTSLQRIRSLKLMDPSEDQLADLERFLQAAASRPLFTALGDLADKRHLWVSALQLQGNVDVIQGIEMVPWRTRSGGIAKWSGLTPAVDEDSPPVLYLSPDASSTGQYSKLEARWKSRPENLARGAVDYRVAIVTDMDEELAYREVQHTGQREQKCRFTDDDFSILNEDALIGAKLVVSVVNNEQLTPEESEEFTIRYGRPPEHVPAGVGRKVRAFSEGVIELEDRGLVASIASETRPLPVDSKGFVLLRPGQRGKSFRVFQPPLIRDVERQWAEVGGAVGRWRVKVRASGARAVEPEFVPFSLSELEGEQPKQLWDRVSSTSHLMAERFAASGGVGQLYDDKSKAVERLAKPYLLAWAALLEVGDPFLALANTVEVQTLSGRTIGLIVLPSHPLRIAWHVAYDNLVLHTAFEQHATPKAIREEFRVLDGAMFPAFLPGLEEGSTFVFADTLGFHAVGMVPDHDKEPKAAVAILARALGESETLDTVPTAGKQSAEVLGNEILKYIDCHTKSRILHVHALRPGDGLTVARALGRVHDKLRSAELEEEPDEGEPQNAPTFVLELYPSSEQRGVAGRFIAEVREKRRSGAGVVAGEDRWMLESLSLPGGINLPKLRWARKDTQDPKAAAHIAVAFDTFESHVVPDQPAQGARPLYAYGLLSFFERTFAATPAPLWRSTVLTSSDGEKHPSERTHTDRLMRMHQAIDRAVARSLGAGTLAPTLRTDISPEKADSLRELHKRCDWVITLDRNGGVEYFDSPRDNREIYDIYVIDTVPERDDLGCLQLVTSTSNLAEVRNLLDGALDQMGLSHSRRNAEFLMDHLKALSGRLAIRLTGQRAATSELIALALSHANCHQAQKRDECWTPLEEGFLIPVDDIRDLIPPLSTSVSHEGEDGSAASNARPDLIYVSLIPRKGLSFQFVEVKYRRHLRASRNPDILEGIHRQVHSLRRRWEDWYSKDDMPATFKAIRRAKLARVLRFYADKARRHYLANDQYETIVAEINRMIEKGENYTFAEAEKADCGWVFCPEYAGSAPLEISTSGRETKVFLFGPGLLPDFDLRRERVGEPAYASSTAPVRRDGPAESNQRQTSVSTPLQVVNTASSIRTGTQSPLDQAGEQPSGPPPTEVVAPTRPPIDVATSEGQQVSVLLGTDTLAGSDVVWPLTIKGNPHLLIAGLPGMGKTTCLLNLCKQMNEADVRPIVFSYHEDIDERLEGLGLGVRFLDFHGLGFNPLQVINRESPMAYLDMAGAIRDIFTAIYPELGDIQGERIRAAIKESFMELGWGNPNASTANLVEPAFGRFVEILRSDPKPDRGLHTLLARLNELGDYGFFDLRESTESLWESDRPTVIRIHKTQNDNLQKAFASLVFYGLYKDMFRRGIQERITHAILFDEAHRAARLRLIPTMAKECRKYGISLVLASQAVKDFDSSVFSAIANYLVLRLTEADARALVRNVASSDLERMLIDKIKQMERFKALYFSEGRKKPSPVALRA